MRVAILDDYQEVALSMTDWSVLEGAEVTTFRDHVTDISVLAERLREFDVICLMRERTLFSRDLIERLPALRFVSTTGSRNAAIDLDALAARHIPVSGTETIGRPTAELAWGLILDLLRHISFEQAAVRRVEWQSTIGRDVAGSRLGVLGLGNLGSRVARIGEAFGCDGVAWSPNLTPQRAAAAGARLVSKDELFCTSDIVTLHLVLSARTKGIVGGRELSLMRPTSILINTSRGALIDEVELVRALQERRIAGAGLDTFDVEPLPAGHVLVACPNTLLTPHLGYVTEETYRAYFDQTVQNILAWLAGRPVRLLA